MDVQQKLQCYHDLLLKWQNKINLISPTTIDDAWERHFEDSAQLLDYVPDTCKTLLDLGSGAGFPALVLAVSNPDLNVHMIESDQKKCAFLKTVSRETDAKNAFVYTKRIEESYGLAITPDIITARALASLVELLDYVWPWVERNSNIILLFPKGEKADLEISEAKKLYNFECFTHTSRTQKSAQILALSNLSKV